MGNVNLYKINTKKIKLFISGLVESYDEADKKVIMQKDATKYEFFILYS